MTNPSAYPAATRGPRRCFTSHLRWSLRLIFALGLAWTTPWVSRTGLAASAAADAGSVPASCDRGDSCAVDPPPPTPPTPPADAAGGATLLFFWGVGCPHCEEARPFIERLRRERRELRIEAIEVRRDPGGRQRFIETMQQLAPNAHGIPTFVVGEQWVTGFTPGVTEAAIARIIDEAPTASEGGARPQVEGVQSELFGWLSVTELGLPAFTVVLGLLDGFNPCAMWVLLFLLATLAGQLDRRRMAITAGTFVVVSGAVYFVFMAAWLSVFLVIGMTRPIQVVLGAVALLMGALNLKDFIAFGRGPTLSIPDSAKPRIFSRVRSVLREHRLGGALLGIAILAVLVNLVELLCTAGLPAIYTSILARHELSTLGRMAYLGLYNLAYIADDALMVTVAVVTLSRRRLAERAGRWLKLASGAVMLALGLMLIFRPEWLP